MYKCSSLELEGGITYFHPPASRRSKAPRWCTRRLLRRLLYMCRSAPHIYICHARQSVGVGSSTMSASAAARPLSRNGSMANVDEAGSTTTSESEIFNGRSTGLPSDRLSLENAAIITSCSRWPRAHTCRCPRSTACRVTSTPSFRCSVRAARAPGCHGYHQRSWPSAPPAASRARLAARPTFTCWGASARSTWI